MRKIDVGKKSAVWNGFLKEFLVALFDQRKDKGHHDSEADTNNITEWLLPLLEFDPRKRKLPVPEKTVDEINSENESVISTETSSSGSSSDGAGSPSLASVIVGSVDEVNPYSEKYCFSQYGKPIPSYKSNPVERAKPVVLNESDEARAERIAVIDYDLNMYHTNTPIAEKTIKVITPFWAFTSFIDDLKNKTDFYDRLMEGNVVRRVKKRKDTKGEIRIFTEQEMLNKFIDHARFAIACKILSIYTHMLESYMFLQKEGVTIMRAQDGSVKLLLEDHQRDFDDFKEEAKKIRAALSKRIETMDFNESLENLLAHAKDKTDALMEKDSNALAEYKDEHGEMAPSYVAPVKGAGAKDEDSKESAAARIAGAKSWNSTARYVAGSLFQPQPFKEQSPIPTTIVSREERKKRWPAEKKEIEALEAVRKQGGRPRRIP